MPPSVCDIAKGEAKFQFRRATGRTKQSMHVECVRNRNISPMMTAEHLGKSKLFANRVNISMWSDIQQERLYEAFTVLQAEGTAASSSSSGVVP